MTDQLTGQAQSIVYMVQGHDEQMPGVAAPVHTSMPGAANLKKPVDLAHRAKGCLLHRPVSSIEWHCRASRKNDPLLHPERGPSVSIHMLPLNVMLKSLLVCRDNVCSILSNLRVIHKFSARMLAGRQVGCPCTCYSIQCVLAAGIPGVPVQAWSGNGTLHSIQSHCCSSQELHLSALPICLPACLATRVSAPKFGSL